MKIICGMADFLMVAGSGGGTARAETLLRFDEATGAHPVMEIPADGSSQVPDLARPMLPGGPPWVIARLEAAVENDGRIRAKGRRVVLSCKDNIGTAGAVQRMAMTLSGGAPAVAPTSYSEPAAIDANGDSEIRNRLDTVPPNLCFSPGLLVRNVNARDQLTAWFAAGSLRPGVHNAQGDA